MKYVKEVFGRANIQEIREFLLQGVGGDTLSDRSYTEQLNISYENMHKYICEKNLHMDNEVVYENIMENVCQVEKVHMEMGLICGFRIACQLLTGIINE